MRKLSLMSLLALGLLLGSCSDNGNGPRPDGIKPTGDGVSKGDGPKGLSWIKQTLDTARAGRQAAIGSAGAVVGLAYYRELEDPVVRYCQAAGLTPAGERPRPAQDLMYLHFDGTVWGDPVKIEQTIGPTYGLSVTFDKTSSKVYVGYLGGELSKNECSSSDAVIASSADGKTFTKSTLSAAGPIGDTVGYWMSLALDSKGQVHAAYHDCRFGYYEQDGKAKASARYDSEIVVDGNGAGLYNSLVFDQTDRPVITFFNPMQKGPTGGVQLAVKEGASWKLTQLLAGATSERPRLATDGKGLFGFAYYEPTDQLLRYLESAKDLTGWKDEVVDPDLTHNGEFASLAFDSKGNPGISYYKCGKYGQELCDPQKDGLKFAYRPGAGKDWVLYEVDTGDANMCGPFTTLTFGAKDEPIIAYQCVQLDNKTADFVATLKVARGVAQ
jgi:hypothetical protein